MRILTTVVSLSVLALVATSCGTEPVGFNIAKVVPLTIPVDLEGINDPKLPVQGQVDPPAYTTPSEPFNLSDVTSDLDLVDEIGINALEYKIEGVDSNEDFQMDEFTIQVISQEGTTILDQTIFSNGQPIANQARIPATGFNSAALTSALANEETIEVTAIIDFAEIPSPIEFDFTFYFDVTAKIRQAD